MDGIRQQDKGRESWINESWAEMAKAKQELLKLKVNLLNALNSNAKFIKFSGFLMSKKTSQDDKLKTLRQDFDGHVRDLGQHLAKEVSSRFREEFEAKQGNFSQDTQAQSINVCFCALNNPFMYSVGFRLFSSFLPRLEVPQVHRGRHIRHGHGLLRDERSRLQPEGCPESDGRDIPGGSGEDQEGKGCRKV